jgi:hypothetical protein
LTDPYSNAATDREHTLSVALRILPVVPKGRILAREHRAQAWSADRLRRVATLEARNEALTTTYCALCSWSHSGTAAEGREAARQHRADTHS